MSSEEGSGECFVSCKIKVNQRGVLFQIVPRSVQRGGQEPDGVWLLNRVVEVQRVRVRGCDDREQNHVAIQHSFENTLYTRWLERMITTRRHRSSPRQGLSTIKYKNRLRLKLMTPSGSG